MEPTHLTPGVISDYLLNNEVTAPLPECHLSTGLRVTYQPVPTQMIRSDHLGTFVCELSSRLFALR